MIKVKKVEVVNPPVTATVKGEDTATVTVEIMKRDQY